MTSDFELTAFHVRKADVGYPVALRDLARAPAGLWISGRLPPQASDRVIAIVGSRGVSLEGCRVVSDLAAALAARAWSVVSGGALGIDAAAHQGALDGGGRTWAVLGCGVDVVYPDRHRDLFRRIAASGGLISEYPPGTAPRPGQFPARNRLVAALASALLVGECRRGSGALITARLAARLRRPRRPIFALPGSAGTDALIASGAAARVVSADDLLEQLAGKPCQVSVRSTEMEGLMMLIAQESGGAADLASRAGSSLARTMELLCEAELEGWVVRVPGGKFEVNRGD